MRVALLFALAITCVVAADISVQYAGTTSGAPSWTAPDLSGATCVAGSTSAPYVTFNATFPFAGVREVSAMAERAFKSYIRVYIYKGSIPADTCTGLAHNQDLSKQFSTDGGPVIDDFVYFDAALYFFVVTGSTGGIFAVHVDPSDAVGSIVAAGPFWNPISIDSSNECGSSGSVNPFSTYSWTQSTTGQFDVYVMFQNNSITDFEPYIALYRGVPTTSDLSISGCNVTTATLVNTSDASDPGLYLPNITLTVGVNYTLVFSLDGEDELANWAVHVIPTRIRYFDGVDGYTQPEREDPGSACTASSDNDAAWGASYFLAENAVYLIDTSEPPYPYAYIDTYSFLYYGANDATPPASCPLFAPLVLSGDTGDITPVYAFTTIGQNYTVVVSTYGGGSVTPTDVYVLYTFTGAPIGSIPQPTAAPTTTGTATGTNTGTTGTNSGTTATRTTSSSTVTGKVTGSASAVVLSTAAALAALVALL